MRRIDLEHSFRVTFGHKTHGKAGELLVQIDVLLKKLNELNIPLRRIAFTSVTRTHIPLLRLSLHITRGERPGRELYFNAEQELVKDQ